MKTQETLTLAEFLRLPETKPASEFWDGRIHQKVSPQGRHSLLQWSCAKSLNLDPRASRIGLALPELRATFAGRSVVPDVSFFTWERLPREANGQIGDRFLLPPDLGIEIVSPFDRLSLLERKLDFCVRNGVRLGWLIDPERELVTVFRPDRPLVKLSSGMLDAAPVIPGFTVSVEEIFGWLIP